MKGAFGKSKRRQQWERQARRDMLKRNMQNLSLQLLLTGKPTPETYRRIQQLRGLTK